MPAPPIVARGDWGGDLAPLGPLEAEAPGDVRFLLVHHTQTPNGYGPDEVATRLRSIYGYHTGTKGWPDVAYNFFVDAHGGVWEGRTGSLDQPVKGDATGGSQGHALLCCFVGDHTSEPPTGAAQQAMAALLAYLADRYAVDLRAGPTISFTSRGSNRWPAGATVTTDPIAGHRDVSSSACPGDGAYGLIRTTLLQGALQVQVAAGVQAPTSSTVAPRPTAPAGPQANAPEAVSPPSAEGTGDGVAAPEHEAGRPGDGPGFTAAAASAGAAVVLGAGAFAIRRRVGDGLRDDDGGDRDQR